MALSTRIPTNTVQEVATTRGPRELCKASLRSRSIQRQTTSAPGRAPLSHYRPGCGSAPELDPLPQRGRRMNRHEAGAARSLFGRNAVARDDLKEGRLGGVLDLLGCPRHAHAASRRCRFTQHAERQVVGTVHGDQGEPVGRRHHGSAARQFLPPEFRAAAMPRREVAAPAFRASACHGAASGSAPAR